MATKTNSAGTVAMDLDITSDTYIMLTVFICIPIVIYFILKLKR